MSEEPQDIQSIRSDTAEDTGAAAGDAPASAFSFDSLLDVAMPVIIEIGRTRMTLNEVMQLKPGSVVPLDRLVGESVDIHVSDRKLAEGEVVVLGNRFGVRVTRLADTDRKAA